MTTKKTVKKKQLTASEIGRLGGLANAKKGKAHMSEIGKKGAAARWPAKKKKSTSK